MSCRNAMFITVHVNKKIEKWLWSYKIPNKILVIKWYTARTNEQRLKYFCKPRNIFIECLKRINKSFMLFNLQDLLMWSVRLSVAARCNLPIIYSTNSCSPVVQLGLNVDDLTDLNGGPPVPLLSRGPPVPLEQPTVFACIYILSQLWVPWVMCPIPIVVHQSN
jgi:hypothetical protein